MEKPGVAMIGAGKRSHFRYQLRVSGIKGKSEREEKINEQK